MVQAAISGITAVIDADGVVHDRTQLFDRTVVQTTVEATSGETPYVRYGEWVTLASLWPWRSRSSWRCRRSSRRKRP